MLRLGFSSSWQPLDCKVKEPYHIPFVTCHAVTSYVQSEPVPEPLAVRVFTVHACVQLHHKLA